MALWVAAYPLLILVLFYGTWWLAWSALGRRPNGSIHDPNHINTTVEAFWELLGCIVVLGFPFAVLGGLALLSGIALEVQGRRWLRAVLLIALPVATWIAMVVVLWNDPHNVLWVFDM